MIHVSLSTGELDRNGNKKYDSGIYIENPYLVFPVCAGKDYKVVLPIELLPYLLGAFRTGMGISDVDMAEALGRYYKYLPNVESGEMSLYDVRKYVEKLELDIKIIVKPKINSNENDQNKRIGGNELPGD